MTRLFVLIVLVCGLVAPALLAQPLVRVYPTTETMIEGGAVDLLVLNAGKQSFALEIPKNYGTQVRLETSSVLFTSLSNISLITVQVTTNFPGTLPLSDDLQAIVAAKFPGASILQPFPCVTGCGPGRGFDLVRPAADGLTVRLRDAYLSFPSGSVEFTFTCNGADFDRQRLGFSRLLNSFRLYSENVTNSP
jgi:hypothetical protein